jgi:hypothetical protein
VKFEVLTPATDSREGVVEEVQFPKEYNADQVKAFLVKGSDYPHTITVRRVRRAQAQP